jgi:hypothetical protein
MISYWNNIEDKPTWLSQWVSSIIFSIGVYLIGNYSLSGPLLMIIGNFIHLIFIIRTKTWGFLIIFFSIGIMHSRNLWMWYVDGQSFF